MKDTLRYRQIHLDFHTSEHIKDVGALFDPEEFSRTLQEGNVDSVTLFARCHHGWCYYPSRVGAPHPHLARPDLLGEMIGACREKGIATPLYLTVQWDERMAREHPEWRVMGAYNRAPHWPGTEPSAMHQLTASWHTLCLEHKGYRDYLIRLGEELIDRYDAEGFFMDILGSHECVCPACLARMKRDGLNPEVPAERQRNDKNVNMDFFRLFWDAMKAKKEAVRIFYNSGHIFKGERDRYDYYSHLELESLPTGGWGYDHFPLSARYGETLGKELLGMTGKFHSHWGEFGGFKRPAALEYECAHMAALGTRCSIGDQLHPSGRIDPETYKTIAPAYARIKALEPYLKGSRYKAQIAILSAEACKSVEIDRNERTSCSDTGAARMLLELQYPFDVIDKEADFGNYALLILPDEILTDAALAEKLNRYTAQGGRLLHSGSSGMNEEKSAFLLKDAPLYRGARSEWNPDYILPAAELDPELPRSPIVMYDAPYLVEGEECLGACLPPYFNRRWDHFCSHLHTPADEGAESYNPGILRRPYGFYFAHNIFRLYYQYGQPLYKYMVRGALEKLIERPLIRTNLPSAGRASLLKQEAEKRYLLNLLYAPTQIRGSGAPSQNGGTQTIEIIEDVPTLTEVEASAAIPEPPQRVYQVSDGKDLPWTYSDGRLSVILPELYIHGAVVIDYGEV